MVANGKDIVWCSEKHLLLRFHYSLLEKIQEGSSQLSWECVFQQSLYNAEVHLNGFSTRE